MLIPFDRLFKECGVVLKDVLHLGANTGQEAEAYQTHGAKRVIWVEALPDVYAELKKHIKEYKNQIALCACLSDANGDEVVFHRANNGSQSSSFLELGTHAVEHPTVKFVENLQMTTIRMDRLLEIHKIEIEPDSFLNVDLQGAELLAMQGMGEVLRRFKYAYVEVNRDELYKGCPMVEEVDEFLAKFGFRGVMEKWTGSQWGDKFYRKN